MAQLAADIVDKCKYIHPSRVEEVEQLLIKLRKHVLSNPQSKLSGSEGPDGGQYGEVGGGGGRSDKRDTYKERDRDREVEHALPPAHLDKLDDYLDMLYQVGGKSEKDKDEGLKTQIYGTGMILYLCRDVMNLEQLIQNGTVMGALTRVLQEEFKKSVDLTFNILRIFLAFSNFMEMHGLMANYRIGLLTLKAVEYEIKRAEHLEAERKQQDADLDVEVAKAKEEGRNVQDIIDNFRSERERENRKQKRLAKKQDKLLFVAFYILINLAEDVVVQRKMIKKQLIESLMSMLDRNYSDLLILVVTFLKKLSIYEENKESLKALNVVSRVSRFIPCSSAPLVNITLRFLFNLSFDAEIREQMMRSGLIPKLVSLLKTPQFRGRTLKLMYHLSVDERCKNMITYTDCMQLLMGMVINFPQDNLAKELAALVINLSYSPRNAEQMVSNHGLNHLMDRLEATKDPLLLKIIRNLTLWTFNQQQEADQPELQYKWRGLWSPHLKILFEMSQDSQNHDILVEVYGCLANMTNYDLPANSNWHKIVREYNFLNQFSKMLVPGMSQNDVLLEIVMLISTMSSDPRVCELIASSNLISLLYQLWRDKGDDVELKLQLIHCFYRLFQNDASREEAMYSTRIVVDIIDCLSHKNAAIRDAADQVTEMVLELDRKNNGELGSLGVQIRKKRFEGYNAQWIKGVGMGGGIGMGSGSSLDMDDSIGEKDFYSRRTHDDDDDDDEED